MKFIHPNEFLASEMVESAQSHMEDSTMLDFSVNEIMQNFESWFVATGQDQKLAGFFCIRRPYPEYTEIGAVRSLVKNGLPEIIKGFEAKRETQFGCAITKDHPEKFINLTNGKTLTFPPWYNRIKSDKNYIQWE